ncbi:MAG: hypothetical protein ACOCV2_02850 [Persicimonas sp.]
METVSSRTRTALSSIATLTLVVAATFGLAEPADACPGGKKADSCPFADEQVEVEANNLDDGARLTLLGEQQDQVDKIHRWASRFEEDGERAQHLEEKGAQVNVETRSDGAEVTVRAEEPEFIEHLQGHFARKADGKGCGGHAHEHGKKGHGDNKDCDHKKGHDCRGEDGECEHASHAEHGCDHKKERGSDCEHGDQSEE